MICDSFKLLIASLCVMIWSSFCDLNFISKGPETSWGWCVRDWMVCLSYFFVAFCNEKKRAVKAWPPFRRERPKNEIRNNKNIRFLNNWLAIYSCFVHFLYSSFLLFFIGIRESHTSICLAQPCDCAQGKHNEPKEKAILVRYFLKIDWNNRSLKTIFQKLNFLQGFKNF